MKIQVIAKEPTKATIFPRLIRVTIYTNSANLQMYVWSQILAQLNVYGIGANIWTSWGFNFPWVSQTSNYDYYATLFYQKSLMSALQYNDLRNRIRATVRLLRHEHKTGLLSDLKGY